MFRAGLYARVSDPPQAPQRGDEVPVGESVCKVFRIESDGQGAVTLALRIE